jgi:hypothetical protein
VTLHIRFPLYIHSFLSFNMRFVATAGLVACAASTVAAHTPASSSNSDLDGSVWQKLSPVNRPSFLRRAWSRPVKRQSGWNPPSELTTPLKEVWDHCLATYSDGNLFGFKNYGWDQLMVTNGYGLTTIRLTTSVIRRYH